MGSTPAFNERIDNYYTATVAEPPLRPALDQDTQTEIAVIGGGFSGINVALELAQRGHEVLVLEANRMGWGASGRNGGQVTGSLSGEVAIRRQLKRRSVPQESIENLLHHLSWRGHELIEQRLQTYGIDCDLQRGHLFAAWSASDLDSMKAHVEALHQRGFNHDELQLLDRQTLQDHLDTPLYHGAILNRRNLHIHALKLLLGEARAADDLGVRLFEHSPALSIKQNRSGLTHIQCPNACVRAERLILAGNAWHRLHPRRLAGSLVPAILGQMVTAPIDSAVLDQINPGRLAVYDSRMILDYYRPTLDNRLLFGGGTNYTGRDIANVQRELTPALRRTFPKLHNVAIESGWNCTDGIVPNRIPMIGSLPGEHWFLQGYSGHGIATSHVLAELLAEQIHAPKDQSALNSYYHQLVSLHHWRLPIGDTLAGLAIAASMQLYRWREN